MCTAAVSRTSALSIGIAHPSSHRSPGHPARRRRRQLRPRTRRLQIPVNHGPLRRALPLAPRTCHTHMRRRPLTRLRRYHLCSPAHPSHRRCHRLMLPRRPPRRRRVVRHRPPRPHPAPLAPDCPLRHRPDRLPTLPSSRLPSNQLLRGHSPSINLRVRVLHTLCSGKAASPARVPWVQPPRRTTLLHEARLRRSPLLRNHRRTHRLSRLCSGRLRASGPALPQQPAP